MAQDVKLILSDNVYDISLDGSDFASVDGLQTAIQVSILTKARASSTSIPEAFRRGGWSGNILTKGENFELGSLLWTLVSRWDKNTENRAISLVKSCLSWLIDDKVADDIDVSIVRNNNRTMAIITTLYSKLNQVGRYSTLWDSTQPTE